VNSITKVLTATDTGANGGHQAGSLIPKDKDILAFFPSLDSTTLNPRAKIEVFDSELDELFELNFIYYNGRKLGKPGKDEYRLTGMTRYLRLKNAQPGDELWLTKKGSAIQISVKKSTENTDSGELKRKSVIRVSGQWKTAY